MIAETTTIPTGYQQTDVGLVPDDWVLRSISDVGTWFSGGTPSKKNPEYWVGEIPWVSPKDMKVLRIRDSIDHISDKAVLDGARVLPQSTILIVVRGMILVHSVPVARAERPVACNQDIKAVIVDDDVDSGFLLYWLAANSSLLKGLTTESTHGTKRLPPESLYRTQIPLPPTLAEQEAIAEALGDADALIESLEQLVAKKRQLKQAAMQQLLTGKKRLPGFEGEWRPKPLGELATFLSGGTPSRSIEEFWHGDIPWISASSLRCFEVFRSGTNVTQQAVAAGSRLAPIGSTLLLVRGSALHKEILCGLVTKQVCFNQDVKALVPVPQVVPRFFTQALRGSEQDLLGLVTSAGNTAGVLETKQLRAFEIRLPHPSEQQAISDVLSDMDTEIEAIEAKLAKARQIKQGMMQELLTGRVRLVKPKREG